MTPVDAGKRLVIVGATGMVGGYALRDALDPRRIEAPIPPVAGVPTTEVEP